MKRTTEIMAKIEVHATVTVDLNHTEIQIIADVLNNYLPKNYKLAYDFKILAQQMKEALVDEGLK
jgi:hypothetical protein